MVHVALLAQAVQSSKTGFKLHPCHTLSVTSAGCLVLLNPRFLLWNRDANVYQIESHQVDWDDLWPAPIFLSLSLAFLSVLLLVSDKASFSAFVQFPLMEINHNFTNLGMSYLLSIILPLSHDHGHRCSWVPSLAGKLPVRNYPSSLLLFVQGRVLCSSQIKAVFNLRTSCVLSFVNSLKHILSLYERAPAPPTSAFFHSLQMALFHRATKF